MGSSLSAHACLYCFWSSCATTLVSLTAFRPQRCPIEYIKCSDSRETLPYIRTKSYTFVHSCLLTWQWLSFTATRRLVEPSERAAAARSLGQPIYWRAARLQVGQRFKKADYGLRCHTGEDRWCRRLRRVEVDCWVAARTRQDKYRAGPTLVSYLLILHINLCILACLHECTLMFSSLGLQQCA